MLHITIYCSTEVSKIVSGAQFVQCDDQSASNLQDKCVFVTTMQHVTQLEAKAQSPISVPAFHTNFFPFNKPLRKKLQGLISWQWGGQFVPSFTTVENDETLLRHRSFMKLCKDHISCVQYVWYA